MFTKHFGSYVCEGDQIGTESGPFTVTARVVRDMDRRIDEDDVHNENFHGPMWRGEDHAAYGRAMEARAAWFRDEWFYCGVVLSVSVDGIEIADHAASLWGIECNYPGGDNAYLVDVANDLLPEAIELARERLARLADAAGRA